MEQGSLEVSGRTVEEAIDLGLQRLGIDRADADVVVLSRGRLGILGIGAEQARVRLSARSSQVSADDAAHAQEMLETLLHLMGVDAQVEIVSSADETPLMLDIHGTDAGLLIGRRGATLQDLQSLTTTIVSRSLKRYVPLRVDVESYQQRRLERIREVAVRAAEHVQQRRRAITLDPMTPAERRVVHTALADHPAVMTQSSGEGEARRVTIYPRTPQRPRAAEARPRPTPYRTAPSPPVLALPEEEEDEEEDIQAPLSPESLSIPEDEEDEVEEDLSLPSTRSLSLPDDEDEEEDEDEER